MEKLYKFALLELKHIAYRNTANVNEPTSTDLAPII